jgi:hypothetical protein
VLVCGELGGSDEAFLRDKDPQPANLSLAAAGQTSIDERKKFEET